ncbi:MAG: cytochrome c [Rhodospirillales bacterium]|nr:cytochrome c [Rhodospirillales bacterium]
MIVTGVSSAFAGESDAPASAEQIYGKWCGHCHDAGPGHPGTQRLEWSFGKDKAALMGRSDLDADYVQQVVRNGRLEMPSFRPTEISNAELDALAKLLAEPK